ncbi:hypothetical protein [Dongia sedimenti]|uniref:Lipoprotein n=1 Tax=Dongia sedimenti TaxID=3064282 RepID=A0ABU0YM39_9PROT|nr:hypothetical protein [Rhodospirillaceae bacterium R-7]
MKMWRWCAIAGFLFLAACQQPPAPGPAAAGSETFIENRDIPQDWSARGGEQKSKYFEAEMTDVRKRMISGLLGGCYSHLQNRGEMEACLRKGLVDTFDDSGQGRSNCKSQTDIDGFTDCIVLGNMAVDLAKRLDANIKVDPAVWTGRRPFADFLGKIVVVSTIAACGDAKTEASATTCMFDYLQSKLTVPEALTKKCGHDLSTGERGSCLAQAATVRFLQEHIARLPGLSI